MEKENWLPVKGYEGLYEVSDMGNVRRVNGNLLTPSVNKGKYLYVRLSRSSDEKQFYIHRLVAMAFLPNPHNHPEVNHKDENKQNNTVSNLEWCSHIYNAQYSKGKAVEQVAPDGTVVKVWSCGMEAERNGFSQSAISKCCLGLQEKHKGFMWRYAS